MESCVFCKIANGSRPASIIYSDEKVMAFLDTRPINPGHTLVIPRAHAAYLSELDQETGAQIFKVAMRIAAALRRSGVKCEGVNLHLADGEAAFQEILHVHLHVIPRFRGDNFRVSFGRGATIQSQEQLNKIAEKINVETTGHTLLTE